MLKLFVALLLSLTLAGSVSAQNVKPKIGAYYFDGWTSLNDTHLTKDLIDKFPERRPKWGWVTSSTAIMKDQIDLAAGAHLSFFSFCWYYNPSNARGTDLLNQSLKYYLQAPNRKKLEFCLMVSNHLGFELGPDDWDKLTDIWINLFKNPQYLKVNQQPFIIFFSTATLIDRFGSAQNVFAAFQKLKAAAAQAGLGGVTIAACVPPDKAELEKAAACGVDVFTGYNYHGTGFTVNPQVPHSPAFKTQAIPISNMIKSDTLVWNRIAFLAPNKPYAPVSTLNWDPRPWSDNKNHYNTAPYYSGYSASSVYTSVHNLTRWLKRNPQHVTTENIGLLYAWNEYGEGAWLTPSLKNSSLLRSVKKALQ